MNSATVARPCYGRTGTYLTEGCKNSRRHWRLTCHPHRWQWLVIPLVIVPWILGVFTGAKDVYSMARGLSAAEIALADSAYTQLSLACHYWKLDYAALYPNVLSNNGKQYASVWERLRDEPTPTYAPDVALRVAPLFLDRLNDIRQRIQEQLAANSNVLPAEVRGIAQGARQQLETDQNVYRILIANQTLPLALREQMFKGLFLEVIATLEKLDAAVNDGRAGLH